MSRPLSDDLVVLMLDGIGLASTPASSRWGTDSEGKRDPLGLREGATENKAVCTRALADPQERGLPADLGLLVVDQRVESAAGDGSDNLDAVPRLLARYSCRVEAGVFRGGAYR
jgi:hypothetical protein